VKPISERPLGEPDRIPFAAILAGGRATRMGRDKAVLELEGFPLIEWVLDRVGQVAQTVFAVGGPPRLDHCGVPTISDRFPGANAMGGVATALAYAAEAAGTETWVLCVACDTPFLEPGLLLGLFAQRAGAEAVVPRTAAGYEPLCALYRTSCLPVFARAIASGNLCILDIFPAVRTREVPEAELRLEDPDLRSFLNLNRPDDLPAALRWAQACGPPQRAAAPASRELIRDHRGASALEPAPVRVERRESLSASRGH
jgi:molybdopterin-guanine dinucleotide biosynthesis protein A